MRPENLLARKPYVMYTQKKIDIKTMDFVAARSVIKKPHHRTNNISTCGDRLWAAATPQTNERTNEWVNEQRQPQHHHIPDVCANIWIIYLCIWNLRLVPQSIQPTRIHTEIQMVYDYWTRIVRVFAVAPIITETKEHIFIWCTKTLVMHYNKYIANTMRLPLIYTFARHMF